MISVKKKTKKKLDLTQMVTEFMDMAKSFGIAERNTLAKKKAKGA